MWVPVVLSVTALVVLAFGFRSWRKKRLVDDVPTSKVRGVFVGLNEVKGTGPPAGELVSYLTEAPCIWYRYEVEEEWRRTVTDTDDEGNTRTRTESGWTTVDSGSVAVPFDVTDDTGSMRVDPIGAKMQGDRVLNETCGRYDPLYYGRGPAGGISDSTGRRRFTESIIPTGVQLYIIGPARLREDVVELEFGKDTRAPKAELYLISTKEERRIARGYGWTAFALMLLAIVIAAFAPASGVWQSRGRIDWSAVPVGWTVVAVAAALVLVGVCSVVLSYNTIVRARQRMQNAWSLIDVQLQQRYELIPSLVAVVRQAASYEAAVQQQLAALRVEAYRAHSVAGVPSDAAVQAASQAATEQVAATTQVLSIAEAYPDLKTNINFLHLQQQLSFAEDRIALARTFFNDSTAAYNTRIGTFPAVLLARPAGFHEGQMFRGDAA